VAEESFRLLANNINNPLAFYRQMSVHANSLEIIALINFAKY